MNKWHPLHSAMYVWPKGHLTNSFPSCLGYHTEMAHSLEARTPFLDDQLTECINRLPPSVKIRWDEKEERCLKKRILREASKPFITRGLYERKSTHELPWKYDVLPCLAAMPPSLSLRQPVVRLPRGHRNRVAKCRVGLLRLAK